MRRPGRVWLYDLRAQLADMRKLWKTGDVDGRREIVEHLLAKVEILEDGSPRWTWRSIEDLLAE